jgi:hypothetical protein
MIRTVGACALAALAVSAVSAVSASAEEYPLTGMPEVGRCVLAVKGAKTGEFKGKNCVAVAPGHKGPYDWLPGPDAKGTFKATLSNPRLETVKGHKIECAFMFLTGEFTNGKGVKVSLVVLQGCQDAGPKTQCYSSPLSPGTIESTQTLIGEIGLIPGSKIESNPWVGVDLKSEASGLPMLQFTCGEALGAVSIAIEGSVIGRIKKTNGMFSVFNLNYKQSKGVQIPTAFKGGLPDVLSQITTPAANPLEKTTEQAGLLTGGEFKTGEALEIKGRQIP